MVPELSECYISGQRRRLRMTTPGVQSMTVDSSGEPVDQQAWLASAVARDITEQKRAQEQQLLLLHELDHRVKNVLA